MAEILIKATDATNSDPEKDRRGCYKRGMPVVVMPDGHPWGNGECLPKFVIIKIPFIEVNRVQKYIEQQKDTIVTDQIYRRRRWQIRWIDLPQGAKTKLQNTGALTIKATSAYTGSYDYTWTQIRTYFRDLLNGVDEAADL